MSRLQTGTPHRRSTDSRAVAAPVRGGDGRVLASLSVSGPTFRLVDRLEAVAVPVPAAAAELSRRRGFHAPALRGSTGQTRTNSTSPVTLVPKAPS